MLANKCIMFVLHFDLSASHCFDWIRYQLPTKHNRFAITIIAFAFSEIEFNY